MIQFLSNVRLAAGVTRNHLTDDPLLLLLQLSRRLPARLVRPLSTAIVRAARPGSAAVPVLLATLVSGSNVELKRRLELDAETGVAGKRALRLANIALAGALPGVADDFLDRSSRGPGLAAARARRLWYDGAVSAAVAILDADGPVNSSLKSRLAAEVSVLNGSTAPVLEHQHYVAVPGRVLHLLTNSLPHTASGYAQRSHSILAAQQSAGWEVLAVTRIGYPVQVGVLGARTEDTVDGVRYRRLLPAKLADTLDARLQQQADELLAIVLDFRPSVLHTTTHYVNALVVRAVARAVGIPWVYEVRGQLADTWASTRVPAAKESERYRLFQDREAEVMRDADRVVTLGAAMKANIVAAGVPEEKVLIAPNAVGGDFLDEPLDAVAARREIGLSGDGRYIGTVSSLVAYEGLDCLIEAFALLGPVLPDVRLLIVGDGVSRPQLEERARRSGFGDRVVFTGRVHRDLAVRYHQALDVFVVPRKDLDVTRSVTPLKPVEALACARPVVASRLPALQEIIDDGGDGVMVPPDDPAALANALASLLRDPSAVTAMGRAGRAKILSTRTWAANAEALAGAYSALCSDNEGKR